MALFSFTLLMTKLVKVEFDEHFCEQNLKNQLGMFYDKAAQNKVPWVCQQYQSSIVKFVLFDFFGQRIKSKQIALIVTI